MRIVHLTPRRGVQAIELALQGALAAPLPGAEHSVLEYRRSKSLMRRPADPIALARIALDLRRQSADLIDCWTAEAAVIAALACGGTPRVARLLSDRCLQCYRTSALVRWGVRRAPLVVVASESARRWLGSRGIDTKRIEIAPMAWPVSNLPAQDRSQALKRLAAPEGVRLIGIPADLIPASRVGELLWAADLVRVIRDGVRFVVMGNGPCRRGLIRFARRACDLEHVRFAKPGAGADWIWPHLDLVWDAGLWLAAPVWIEQTLSQRIPIVGADSHGMRERLAGVENSWLVAADARERAGRVRITDRLLDQLWQAPESRRQQAASAPAGRAEGLTGRAEQEAARYRGLA